MSSISEVLDRFNAVFNEGDLDAVMAHFRDDAEYRPGDGSVHRGAAAIRAAFAPQFAGALGRMRFDLEDQLIDEAGRKAALRWICRHDLGGDLGRAVPIWLRLFVRLRHGNRMGWRGVDVFHFDEHGLICAKFTYANYDRPQLRADLGAPLGATSGVTPTTAAVTGPRSR